MKQKLPKIMSIIAIVSFLSIFIITMLTEPEITEAIVGGLVIGGAVGSIFGIIALILNKEKSKLIIALSVIPMCPIVIYAFLVILNVTGIL